MLILTVAFYFVNIILSESSFLKIYFYDCIYNIRSVIRAFMFCQEIQGVKVAQVKRVGPQVSKFRLQSLL